MDDIQTRLYSFAWRIFAFFGLGDSELVIEKKDHIDGA